MTKPKIDEDLIRRLAKLLEETGLSELEYSTGNWRIRVSRALPTTAPPGAPEPAPVARTEQETAAEAAVSHPGAVTSPMVGTVYVAPEPGAPPFIKTDDMVSEGQTLLLIEAMKTMNPIRASRPGRVTQIFVTNATPVEYGEVLLILE
ncbi:MAG: biotin/lipoyl-containing protein [Alphaproteobacteria bacterium]